MHTIGPAYWLFASFSAVLGVAMLTQPSPTEDIWVPNTVVDLELVPDSDSVAASESQVRSSAC